MDLELPVDITGEVGELSSVSCNIHFLSLDQGALRLLDTAKSCKKHTPLPRFRSSRVIEGNVQGDSIFCMIVNLVV